MYEYVHGIQCAMSECCVCMSMCIRSIQCAMSECCVCMRLCLCT